MGLGWLTARPERRSVRSEAAGGHGGALAGFVVWLAVQLVGSKWGEPFWRGDSKLFAEVMADAVAESLAVERFSIVSYRLAVGGLNPAWLSRRICHQQRAESAVIGLVAVGIVQAGLGIALA